MQKNTECAELGLLSAKEPVRTVLVEGKRKNKQLFIGSFVLEVCKMTQMWGRNFYVLEKFFPLFHILH